VLSRLTWSSRPPDRTPAGPSIRGGSRQFTSFRSRFDRVRAVRRRQDFHLPSKSQNEGPGVGYRGLFCPKVLSQTWASAYLKFARRRLLVTPPIKPPSVGLAASALPRAGAVLVQNWYFSGAAPMLAQCQAPSTSARVMPSCFNVVSCDISFLGCPRLARSRSSLSAPTAGRPCARRAGASHATSSVLILLTSTLRSACQTS